MRRSLRAAASAWFSGGLSFECTLCGKCCKRADRPVLVNACEVEEMAQILDMDIQKFSEEYLTEGSDAVGDVADKLMLKRGKDGKSCVFLGRDNKCRVHEAKPIHCRTYPFHPEHLISEFDWNAEAAACEGMTPIKISSDSKTKKSNTEESSVSKEDIVKNLFMAELNRDEMPNESHSSLAEMIGGLQKEALDEFASDYVSENWRKILYEDEKHFVVASQFSGEESERRAFIFKNTPTFVQTEIPYFPEGDKRRHDMIELLQPPHQGMVLSLYLWLKSGKNESKTQNSASDATDDPPPCRVAVLGAGCGALPNAILDMDVEITPHVDAVEIDPDVVEIGRKWFDFDEKRHPRLRIHCQDALKFMETSKRGLYDLILIDVASSGMERGALVAPPADFYREEFLNVMHARMSDSGIVAVNVAGERGKSVEVFRAFQRVFPQVVALNIPSQEVVFAKKGGLGGDLLDKLKQLVDEKESLICDVARGTLEEIEANKSKIGVLMGWCNGDTVSTNAGKN
ncbi:hypothetical protein BSKO_13208 [Bryopsis sp. KO-2023]|nr:hypothetical protein BSKO_13208 [Bryopsis sp. KO-2023]